MEKLKPSYIDGRDKNSAATWENGMAGPLNVTIIPEQGTTVLLMGTYSTDVNHASA